ncbi:diacylglycerol/lipid kinase family protein [Chloroflexota bacterium]
MPYSKFIVNPAAGAGKTARRWPHIMALLKSIGLRFEHDWTEAPGHATELAREAVQKGYEQIVSVGGDGTINEVVNGLYASGNIKDVLMGIISMGTGGDYARTIGLRRPYQETCRCFVNPGKMTVDLGIMQYMSNGSEVHRLFANFAGMGFDAEIVRRTTQQFKSLGSAASYLLGLFTTLVSYKNRAVSLVIDGEMMNREVCTVIMNNGKYGGGGMLTAPDADLTDGYLDVLIVGNLSKPDLLRSLPSIYKGTHLTHPKVELRKAREIEVRTEESLFLQADGELLGQVPARFSILPQALNVVV